MAIYVATNSAILQGRRNLDNVHKKLDVSFERLSSGKRINSAKDDAAGLQISDRLTTQINGLDQGNRNASDGIALLQTIEGGLDEVNNMLQRIRTLAVQSANGTNTEQDRLALNNETSSLSAEINRIASSTKFGGKTILNGYQTDSIYAQQNGQAAGTAGSITLQVGANSQDSVSITVDAFSISLINNNLDGEPTDTDVTKNTGIISSTTTPPAGQTGTTTIRFSVSSIEQAQSLISLVDKFIAKVDEQRGNIGAMQNRLESSIRNQANVSANQSDARSRIRDSDFAHETSQMASQTIMEQSATAMMIHANAIPKVALTLLNI